MLNLLKGLCMIVAILWFLPMQANAVEATCDNAQIEIEGFTSEKNIIDDNVNTYAKASEENNITVSREDGIGSVYIKFDRIPEKWTLAETGSNKTITCGENAFLHEYVEIGAHFDALPEKLILHFAEGTSIADIYVFSEGERPAWVQAWEAPCKKADLLLVSSHSDDEQLFFLGVLPYYAGELGLNVQVAYVVQHFEANGVLDHKRPHEQLDGLWTVGVKNYPVMSDFPDLYAKSKDRNVAFNQAKEVYAKAGITYEDFVEYMTECIRRFEPLVVVSHDLDGEYGHGTHVMAAKALTEAIGYAADETKFEDSAKTYGTWEIEKLYLHLYEENPIVMDYDKPLANFGGKTAYQVSCDGFACHKSQHWTWFYKWIYGSEDKPITKASQIRTYSPCKYGLYYTGVGTDTVGGDFFENVKTHGERLEEKIKEHLKQLIDTVGMTLRGVL